jgi:hypothetical protein
MSGLEKGAISDFMNRNLTNSQSISLVVGIMIVISIIGFLNSYPSIFHISFYAFSLSVAGVVIIDNEMINSLSAPFTRLPPESHVL